MKYSAKFSEKSTKFLDYIMHNFGFENREEIIRNSIKVYEFLLRKDKEGYKIKFIKK